MMQLCQCRTARLCSDLCPALAAYPYWQETQNAFLREFGRSAWSSLAPQLEVIVGVARTMPGE
jgi:hypothetical protein